MRHSPGAATRPPTSGPSVAAPNSAGTITLAVAPSFSLPKLVISAGRMTMNSTPPARPCSTCAASSTPKAGASALASDVSSETPSSQKYRLRLSTRRVSSAPSRQPKASAASLISGSAAAASGATPRSPPITGAASATALVLISPGKSVRITSTTLAA